MCYMDSQNSDIIFGKKKKIPYPNNSEKHCVVLSTSGKIDSEQNPSLPFPQYSWNPALLETVNRVMRRVQNNPESSDEPWQLSNRRVMWAASWFRRSPYGSSREHCSEGSKRRNRHHLWETVRMINRGIWPETSTKWQRRNCGSERMSPKQSVRLSNRQKHGGIRTQLVTGNSLRCFRCFSVFLF